MSSPPHDVDDARTGSGVGVVVVSAGSGTRLGADRPKAFVEVGGHPILEHALDGALPAGVDEVVVVAPPGWEAEAEAVLDLVAACPCAHTTTVVTGGDERTDSVGAGLDALSDAIDVVLVHDAARCLTPTSVYERVIAAVRGGAAGAVPGVQVVDTIKVVDGRGVITATPERSTLRAVQTPQGFRADVLRAAHASGLQATDDAALVEALGHDVVVVDGDPMAFKITTTADLDHAVRLLDAARR